MVNDQTLIWKSRRRRLPTRQVSRAPDPQPPDGRVTKEEAPARTALPGLPISVRRSRMISQQRTSASQQRIPVWRVYRIQGSKAIVVATLKSADADSALKQILDKLNVTDPDEQTRYFARLDE